MNKREKLMNTVLALAFCGGMAVAQEESLFNGKDLTGWDAAPGWWTVEDGALTAQSTPDKPCKKCNYLIWKGGQPENFELTADFRLSEKANSGIQLRSVALPEWDTCGYQADVTGDGKLAGFVYHHKRGLIAGRGERVTVALDGKKTVEKLGDPAELLKSYKPGEWNTYRIICKGPEITLYVNGVMMCQFTDNDAKQAATKGVIALQMHPGPPMKVQFKNLKLKTAIVSTGVGLPSGQGTAGGREGDLIAVLKSDAEYPVKAVACLELGRIGTAEAVPALAALLADDKLADMARYGLEPIPGPAVEEALRAALGKLKGRFLVGVIASSGVRHDSKAVGTLIGLLSDPDAEVSRAAALALGKIGTPEAIKGLQGARVPAQTGQQRAVCDALLLCAETLAAAGRNDEALAIVEALRSLPQAPYTVRDGAWREAILLRQKAGLPLLIEALRSTDYGLVLAAARISGEMKGSEVTKALAEELDKSPADKQILISQTLGKRRDAAAVSALLRLSRAGEKAVRLAAIKAVAEIGSASAAAPLIELLSDPDKDIVQIAGSSLVGLPGAEVDEFVLKGLGSLEQALKLKMIDMAGQRRLMRALPFLQRALDDKEDAVRLAAFKSYGMLAGNAELPGLLERITVTKKPEELEAFEKVLGSICSVTDDPKACAQQLAAALPKAEPEAKQAVLRKLRVVGGPEALKAVCGALSDASAEVRAAALKAVGEWKTTEAVPVLQGLVKSSGDPAVVKRAEELLKQREAKK
jgi:HEAT repeat protein